MLLSGILMVVAYLSLKKGRQDVVMRQLTSAACRVHVLLGVVSAFLTAAGSLEYTIALADIQALIPRKKSLIKGVSTIMARTGAKGGAALGSIAAVKIGESSRACALTNGVAFNNSLSTAVSALAVGMRLDTSGVKVAFEEIGDLNHTNATHGTLAVAVAAWFAANSLEVSISMHSPWYSVTIDSNMTLLYEKKTDNLSRAGGSNTEASLAASTSSWPPMRVNLYS